MTLDLSAIQIQFPSVDRPAILFENPGGTQIAQQSLDRINQYLLECNANHKGAIVISIASDAILDTALMEETQKLQGALTKLGWK